MTRKRITATKWSHEGFEGRGYHKCPICPRHLVKIEDHLAAHRAGFIGPDGRRRDRTASEQRRWTERFNGRAATERFRSAFGSLAAPAGAVSGGREVFVDRAVLRKILELPPLEPSFTRDVDGAVEDEE